ncbi:MAG: NUDIX hydrolase [Ruminococcus sp.]|nr:NUDIX hydrolase [Ruminococcus sp.]
MKELAYITDKDIIGKEGLTSKPPRMTSRAFLFNDKGEAAVAFLEKVDFYNIPGGGMNEGETPEQCLKREILEETGYECEILAYLGYVLENRGQADFSTRSDFFAARVSGSFKGIDLTERERELNARILWVSVDKLKELILYANKNGYREEFQKRRNTAAVKALEEWLDSGGKHIIEKQRSSSHL